MVECVCSQPGTHIHRSYHKYIWGLGRWPERSRGAHSLTASRHASTVPMASHGIRRLSPRHSADRRGHATGLHGPPKHFAERRGGPWHLSWQFPRQSPRRGPRKFPEVSTTVHGKLLRHATVQLQDQQYAPRQYPRKPTETPTATTTEAHREMSTETDTKTPTSAHGMARGNPWQGPRRAMVYW